MQATDASELATSQSFVAELCDLLDLPRVTHQPDYMFERPLKEHFADGGEAARRIDCYRRGHFVWESKKLRQIKAGSDRFKTAMLAAHAQAQAYARALPASEGRVPFLMVADVGHVIELYADFTRSGATYTPFPDARSHRIALADLALPEVQQRLRLIWTNPDALDPSRIAARVTREVADQLARLARSMEEAGQRSEQVAAFLTRCLFSMFAEDVELLPAGAFIELLRRHRATPQTLANALRALWTDMDRGGERGYSATLGQNVLRFNGKLFKGSGEDGYSLVLTTAQIDQLIAAAHANWREVEPAIFGTLLERALNPVERHALGAHYTPRAYVERLVMPTVIEPLRAEWADAQAAAVLLAQEAEQWTGASKADQKKHDDKLAEARAEVRRFHHRLCTLRVLDPACGSGNFLYVTLEHLKRLEGEVLNLLHDLGDSQAALGLEGETVTLQQLRGIELNPRAAAMAELVLWIGFLQWHIRTRGNAAVAEPVVHDYGNIECRDAVLAWDAQEPALDANGKVLTRWDGRSFKPHPVTGKLVPDESAQIAQWKYTGARKAAWPKADFIVGNPPFIGASSMRAALGDGYVQSLRATWKDVPESADFVMYWWQHAAAQVLAGTAQRFGFITTNSIRQTFNRRVLQKVLDSGLELSFAIPDHPWVDSTDGAAVRIAMTVAQPSSQTAIARLLRVERETGSKSGESAVLLAEEGGVIHADLSIGANVGMAVALQANGGISSPGVKLHGAGFIVTKDEATALGLGTVVGLDSHIRAYRNGRDLTDRPRDVMVIDLFGLSAHQARNQFPAAYQRVTERVKPERDQNNRATYRDSWWIFGEPRRELRPALAGLPRYIATVETSKHRTFQFLDASILPDNMLIAIASDDAHLLGVLSSRTHIEWALATGARLGVGNDPRYNKSRCFETFPFPDEDTGLTPALRVRIGALAEQIDAHRKRQQAAHATLTLTGMYNVLELLRANESAARGAGVPRALTPKEKIIHEQGLVGVLKELHDELDAAVLEAYGWADLRAPLADGGEAAATATATLLERLVALNARRAAEEKAGTVRWLRPEFQNPAAASASAPNSQTLSNKELVALENKAQEAHFIQSSLDLPDPAPRRARGAKHGAGSGAASPASASDGTSGAARPWPATLPEQMRAVADLLGSAAAASTGLSLAEVEIAFKSRGAWKKSLPRILETLEAVGRARVADAAAAKDGRARWRSVSSM